MATRKRWIRTGLLVLGLTNLAAGLMIRLAPRRFYDDFPGFGSHWVRALGPYDGHLVTDYGAALTGLAAALLVLGLRPSTRALPLLLGAWLVAAIPHLLYHAVVTDPLSAGDNIINIAVLGLTVAIPLALLVLDRREQADAPLRRAGAAAPPLDSNSRVALAPERGLFRRVIYRQTRKELGMLTTPVAVTAHHPGLTAGYLAFELATMKAERVEARLKHLASLRAAMVVGCEYCVDIGSELSRRGGISDDELRDLVAWRESPRFDELDRLVLEYSEAMTRTPAVIPQDLFDRLRTHLDEPQLVELTSVIGIENYRARFNWAFGIAADGFSEGAFCVPPDPVVAAT